MKKAALFLMVILVALPGVSFAPSNKSKAEVLYFKANLACCKAKACNMLEAKVKEIVEKNWTDGTVTFRQVKLSDSSNNQLVQQYNAQSQTLIVLVTKKKKVTSFDLSAQLKEYVTSNDVAKFEKDLIGKINELLQ
jgi:hypothetical protein